MTCETEEVDVRVQMMGEALYNTVAGVSQDPAEINTVVTIALAMNAARNAHPGQAIEEVKARIRSDFEFILDQLWVREEAIRTGSNERGS